MLKNSILLYRSKLNKVVQLKSKWIFICSLLLIVFLNLRTSAQPIISKSLPKPKFFVLGISLSNFPKLEGSWEDTLAMLNYGKKIDLWLKANPTQLDSVSKIDIRQFKNQINTELFNNLNDDEKLKFKRVANKLSYIIIGQKEILLEEYYLKHQGKKNRVDFYNEIVQIYFINQVDLNYLSKQIKE